MEKGTTQIFVRIAQWCKKLLHIEEAKTGLNQDYAALWLYLNNSPSRSANILILKLRLNLSERRIRELVKCFPYRLVLQNKVVKTKQ